METTRPTLAETLDRLGWHLRAEEQHAGLLPVQWEILRYLKRANRFSNTPGAVGAYLGFSKGTISQTLIALERKGLIVRRKEARDRRQTGLHLTDAGRALLDADPLAGLEAALADEGLAPDGPEADALWRALARQRTDADRPTFGVCATCRHFDAAAGGGYRCALLEVALSPADSARICAEHAFPG